MPLEARRRYFDRHAIDARTRAEVESLLAFDTKSSTTLQGNIGRVAQRALETLEPKHSMCGPYRLLELLGRGGMGAVYLAERIDGEIASRVAIKLLRPGADDPQLRRRFLAERQILATLSHPNIGRLLDAGHRDDGQPYLAMEYVEGKAVDIFTAALSLPQKVALFLKICGAVAYLHANLVVHRDLKPANILVTGQGEPKLLDFGIAKMMDDLESTITSLRVLTPEYASPEQVAGKGVSTATDIYSLGAVLYKVLTGSSPHRLSPDLAPAVASAAGQIPSPASLVPSVKRDLEVIVMKALRTESHERYATIQHFAEDLENYLESRPVRARHGDAWYRTRKFLRRHWLPVTASTLAAASLAAGILVANHQRVIAQRRFDDVHVLANVFLWDFEHSIRDVPGTLGARHLVASTGQKYLKKLAAESRYDPALDREIAEAYERLADIEASIRSGGGRTPGDIESLLQSLEIHRRLGDHRSANPALRRKYIEMAALLGYWYQDERNANGAVKWAGEAMALSDQWLAREPQAPDALAAATAAYTRGATTQEIAGHIDTAARMLEKSIDYGERALAAARGNRDIQILASDAHGTYSELLANVKRHQDALAHGRRAIELIEPLWTRNPHDPLLRRKFVHAGSAVGIAEHLVGESDRRHLKKALPYLERALSLAEEDMRADPVNASSKSAFIVHSSRLSSLLI